jgi:oligopeptidase B
MEDNHSLPLFKLYTYLIDQNTSPAHLYAEGGSAGGLMGVILNMAPQLYHGVIAQVPFVDVATTMLDETIPLTTGEYDEWEIKC